MAEENEKKEGEEVKKPKPKTIIQYSRAGKKSYFIGTIVDKKGNINKVTEKGDDALKALKKFVNDL